jgi:hypothetical protein
MSATMAKRSALLSTTTIDLRTLLSNGKRYEVPPYQRDYSWTQEQWEDLWLDIEDAASGDRPHYMGALVLQEDRNGHFRVIDGQQRIATLSLVVVAALHCLREMVTLGADPEAVERRISGLRTSFLGAEHPGTLQTLPKLTLNRANHRFYEATLLGLATPPSIGALTPAERPLWDAMTFFRTRLAGRFLPTRDDAGLANFLYEAVATQLLFIQVNVEDEAGAYTVFETLNARGLDLSAGDLLKNYLLSVVHPEGESSLRQAQDRWQIVTERIAPRDLPEFLRHFLNSDRPFVRQERVFREIRATVTRPAEVFRLLDELGSASLLCEALGDAQHALWDDAPDAGRARAAVRELNLFGVAQYRPLAIAVWRTLGTGPLADVLRACAVVSFRYNVIGQRNTNKLEEVYNGVAREVSAGRARSAAEVRALLAPIYPSDDEFREAFAKRSIPAEGRRTKLVRYILCAIENQDHSVSYDWEAAAPTVEHVLPRSPDDMWSADFPGETHERYVSRLGNYLLLESKLNSRLAGNRPLADKAVVYHMSQYPATQAFDAETWVPVSIDQRQARMARTATAVWRM